MSDPRQNALFEGCRNRSNSLRICLAHFEHNPAAHLAHARFSLVRANLLCVREGRLTRNRLATAWNRAASKGSRRGGCGPRPTQIGDMAPTDKGDPAQFRMCPPPTTWGPQPGRILTHQVGASSTSCAQHPTSWAKPGAINPPNSEPQLLGHTLDIAGASYSLLLTCGAQHATF